MPKRAKEIIAAVEDRFGKDAKPSAIVLTHGHFDHTGNIVELIKKWNVPVYAHELEFPFLTGMQSYPKPDTSKGGLLAKISFIYPIQPIDISTALNILPDDHSIPFLDEWTWIHTPGHTPGHVSLFRIKERTLIAGDAFTTVKQDSLYNVLVQKEEVNGPPVYLTMDWNEAKMSIEKLQALKANRVITGHGKAMGGDELREGLLILLENFSDLYDTL